MLNKYLLAAFALIATAELASAAESVGCTPAAELVQNVSCKLVAEPARLVGVKALYGNVEPADLMLTRINNRGASLATVISIIVFLPSVAILFFSWLVKSSK